jgi:hypothetical protein
MRWVNRICLLDVPVAPVTEVVYMSTRTMIRPSHTNGARPLVEE